MTRILFLASTKSSGGIERHAIDLASALWAQDVSVQFACPPGSFLDTSCRQRGIPILPFRVRNSGDFGAAFRLAAMIRAQKIAIVHAHSRRDYVVAVLGVAFANRLSRRKTRLILHAHLIRPLGEPPRLSGKFFRWGTDAVIAVSEAVRERLQSEHGFQDDFVTLIPNGIRLDDFARHGSPEAGQQRSRTRRAWGIAEEAPVLGMVGRLDSKGQRALIAITPRLRERHPNLQIVLVGSEGETGEQERLTASAAATGVADCLLFTGPHDDVPALLPAFDILVHLPLDESFGLALAEAMAAGLPTVATKIGGCREVVRDGVTGFLVPPGDEEALTDALLALLDPVHGQERRAAMGVAGRQIVEAEFTQERQIQSLLTLYHLP